MVVEKHLITQIHSNLKSNFHFQIPMAIKWKKKIALNKKLSLNLRDDEYNMPKTLVSDKRRKSHALRLLYRSLASQLLILVMRGSVRTNSFVAANCQVCILVFCKKMKESKRVGILADQIRFACQHKLRISNLIPKWHSKLF